MESLLLQDLDSSKISFFEDKSNFWIKTYKYYNDGGYKYIYTNNIAKLLTSYSLIVIVNFLLNCVDYSKLLTLDSHDNKLEDFINIDDWFPKNAYLVLCFLIYSIYLVCITIDCIITISTYRKFKLLMNDFYGIHDNKIKYMTWSQLVDIIIERNDEHAKMLSTSDIDMNAFNIYEENLYIINSILCRQGNIIISIFRSKVFTMPRISKLLEWNFIYCIVDPLMNINGTDLTTSVNDQSSYTTIADKEIDNDYSYANAIGDSISGIINLDVFTNTENDEEKEKLLNRESLLQSNNTLLKEIDLDGADFSSKVRKAYINKVNRRINMVLIINLIALPFALLILGIYIALKYGEQFYHNPKLIYERQLDLRTKCQMKYYNEVPDAFRDRIRGIENNMNQIINQYRYSVLQIIYRLIVFILGSIFIILFMFTIIGGNQFANIILFDNKSIFWFLSVIGTLLLVFRNSGNDKYMNKKEKNDIIDKLKDDIISINQKIDTNDKEYLINVIKYIYPYKIMIIFNEVYFLVLSIYYLILWKYEINHKSNSIFNLIEYNYKLGIVSKYSIFENKDLSMKNKHMQLSIEKTGYML